MAFLTPQSSSFFNTLSLPSLVPRLVIAPSLLPSPPERHFTIRPSTCSHSSQTGQELCYLCHQRALKNIPVDVSGERQDKERRQDQLLQEYQHQKDLIALAREQTVKMVNGGYNKEIASFNLEAAETKKVLREEPRWLILSETVL